MSFEVQSEHGGAKEKKWSQSNLLLENRTHLETEHAKYLSHKIIINIIIINNKQFQ